MAGELDAVASGPAGWLTGALLAVLGVWKAYRTIKTTTGDDRAVARREDYQDDLISRIDHLEKRADMFAAEKNMAVLEEAKAKGKLEAALGKMEILQTELDGIKASRVEAKELVQKLGEQINQLRDENERLKKRIKELEDHINSCEGARPEMAVPVKWEDAQS
jgi:chromosome segregation ATPase